MRHTHASVQVPQLVRITDVRVADEALEAGPIQEQTAIDAEADVRAVQQHGGVERKCLAQRYVRGAVAIEASLGRTRVAGTNQLQSGTNAILTRVENRIGAPHHLKQHERRYRQT